MSLPSPTSSKTVFITGTSRGIGLTLAEHYVQSGWNVIATCRNPQAAEKVWKGRGLQSHVEHTECLMTD